VQGSQGRRGACRPLATCCPPGGSVSAPRVPSWRCPPPPRWACSSTRRLCSLPRFVPCSPCVRDPSSEMLSCVCCVRREGEGEIRSAIRSAQCAMGRRSAWTTRQRRRAALRELRSCAAGAAAARGTHAAQEEVVQHVVEVTQSEKMVATQAHYRALEMGHWSSTFLFAVNFLAEVTSPVAAQC
jgi:hypothetical protein